MVNGLLLAKHTDWKFVYSILFFLAYPIYAMKIDKPEYYLKLEAEKIPYLVLVNGVELERDFDGYSVITEMPINHLIKNGKNTFGFLVPPEEYHEGEFDPNNNKVEIWVRGTSDSKSVEYKLADIIYKPELIDGIYKNSEPSMRAGVYSYGTDSTLISNENGNLVLGEITEEYDYLDEWATILTRSFTAEVDFPPWLIFKGEKIVDFPLKGDNFENAEKILFPELEVLQKLFDSREIEKILTVFEDRSSEYDIAYYKKPGTTLRELENSIRNTFENGYSQIVKDSDYMQLVSSSDGRVATIVNAGSMNGTIMFDAGDDFVISYNAYWIRKDGEWIIAR